MNTNSSIIRLILASLLLFWGANIFAHDPGLSRANVRVEESSLVLQLTLADVDAALLLSPNIDYVQKLNRSNFSSAQARLQSIFAKQVWLSQNQQIIHPDSTSVQLAPDGLINVFLAFQDSPGSAIELKLAFITQLSRGHRLYLTVENAAGKMITQHILDAESNQVMLQNNTSSGRRVFREYLKEGIWHIWIGADHLLFLTTLLLPAVFIYRNCQWQSRQNVRSATVDILKVVTAFTLAHSITLLLAALKIIVLPSRVVESVIALSVVLAAINNLRPYFPSSRWLLAFGFGLIHGFGFASVLLDLSLPENALLLSLVGFNLGVEFGQLVIVALLFPLLVVVRNTAFYRNWIFNGGSLFASLIGAVWVFERLFDSEILGF